MAGRVYHELRFDRYRIEAGDLLGHVGYRCPVDNDSRHSAVLPVHEVVEHGHVPDFRARLACHSYELRARIRAVGDV